MYINDAISIEVQISIIVIPWMGCKFITWLPLPLPLPPPPPPDDTHLYTWVKGDQSGAKFLV